MKKYLIVNKKTESEYNCYKCTIRDFDYYFSILHIDLPPNKFMGYAIYAFKELFYIYGSGIWTKERWSDGAKLHSSISSLVGYRKLIATNNPEISVPKILNVDINSDIIYCE